VNRKTTWAAAALAVAIPLLFATPADATVTTDGLSPEYAGIPATGAAADHPASLQPATDRQLLPGGGASSAPDSELGAIQEQVIEQADGALGFRYDHAADEFVVVYPDGEAASPAEFGPVADEIRIEESTLSAATVAEFAEAVEGRTFHPDAADYSYGSYVDVTTDAIVLGTDAPADVIAPLVESYGDAVEVRSGESGRLRQSDPEPHWGGASITDGGGVCTSGFTGQTGGVRVMVTAGHCSVPGGQIFSTGGGQFWGTFGQHVNFPDPDLAIIVGTTYQGAIYLGGVNSTSGAAVSSFADPVMGFNNYCWSGQTSGEVCGNTVVSFAGTLCDPAGCTFNLTVSNGPLVQPGDSGSPWFVYSAGNVLPVHIRGITIGVVAGQNYWHRYSQVVATGVTGVPFP
jgi:hypothetical protein